MDVDAALASVPVNKLPLIDDTDFKTIEDAVVYNQAGLALFWNFTTTAGVTTVTAVTPTTAGVYDWTDFTTSGMYGIEIPASGGASANNDTEGFGHFTGVATGILPWSGPKIGFRAAALNNALIDGGDNLDVNLVQWLGTAAATPTTAGVPEVDVTHVSGVAEDISTETKQDIIDTNIDQIEAAVITNAAGVDIAADIIAMKAETALIVADTNELQVDDVPGLIAALNDLSAAQVNAECDTALTDYDAPTNAEMEARTPTAAQLAYIVANAATGLPVTFTTSGGSTTAAVLNLVDGSAGSAVNDQYNGRLLVFTNGTLKGVVTDITDYVGSTTTATITAIPTAPTASHTARLI